MFLSDIGNIVSQNWKKINQIRKNISLDEFVIMPNHLHGVIDIDKPVETIHNLNCRDVACYVSTGDNKEFYSKMGIYKIKFKPVYNPYTEPSMEAYGYNEQLGKWIELINSGVFRPESLEPYGINVPVIAWGLGIDRLAMFKLGINDIRQLFSTDLKWLREAEMVV